MSWWSALTDAAEQAAWVGRVLGVVLPNAGGQQPPDAPHHVLATRIGAAGKAVGAFKGKSRGMVLALREANTHAKEGDARGAQMLVERAEAMLQEAALRQAAAAWRAARTVAINGLDQLQAALSRSDAPERAVAGLLLQGVGAKLVENPATLADIESMQDYLATDGIVAAAEGPNAFDLAISVRTPLARALAELQAQMAARDGHG